MNNEMPEEALPGSWLIGELGEIFGAPDEIAPCPKCGGECARIVGGLWSCDECGGVWTAAQIAQRPV